jgi:hypothetical protein
MNCYITKRNIEIIISKALVEERTQDKTTVLQKYTIPTEIICAEK